MMQSCCTQMRSSTQLQVQVQGHLAQGCLQLGALGLVRILRPGRAQRSHCLQGPSVAAAMNTLLLVLGEGRGQPQQGRGEVVRGVLLLLGMCIALRMMMLAQVLPARSSSSSLAFSSSMPSDSSAAASSRGSSKQQTLVARPSTVPLGGLGGPAAAAALLQRLLGVKITPTHQGPPLGRALLLQVGSSTLNYATHHQLDAAAVAACTAAADSTTALLMLRTNKAHPHCLTGSQKEAQAGCNTQHHQEQQPQDLQQHTQQAALDTATVML